MKRNFWLLGLVLLVRLCRESQPASIFGLNYNPEDFVVAQPTCVHRLPLTRVNRLWRGKGIRSFTVVNNTELVRDLSNDPLSQQHLEAYGYWEDDSLGSGSWRGGNVGDTRAAVTPFLAHRHFGETYKWMLYGDDDTLFYMTGVLKLLAQFDPEQPLAITDNIWFYAKHTHPGAPRCLPCGFNTSTIVTNHTFIPRPACPFCTRALACGTYGTSYRCNASHLATLESQFGPSLLTAGTAANGSTPGGSGRRTATGRFREAMQFTAGRYAAWMDHHVALKARYPYEYRDRPTMDWEMRDRSDWQEAESTDSVQADDTSGESDSRRRWRRRLRRRGRQRMLLQQRQQQQQQQEKRPGRVVQLQDSGSNILDPDLDLRLDLSRWEADEYEEVDLDLREEEEEGLQQHPSEGRRRRRQRQLLLYGLRKPPVAQGYVDGSKWLSAALGRPLGDPERQALQLPYPFCARHDDRLHGAPAPSCLLSVAGHGGTGIIFSVGLMRMIETEEALRYIMTQKGCGGGDCLLGRLVWFRMGIGFTDPGTALQYGATKYEKYCRFVDSNEQLAQIAALSDPSAMLLGRRRSIPRSKSCDHSCVWLFENVVGLHVRAQNRQVNNTVVEMVKRIQSHKRAYKWMLQARQDPAVKAGQQTVVRWIKARYGNLTLPNITYSSLEGLASGAYSSLEELTLSDVDGSL